VLLKLLHGVRPEFRKDSASLYVAYKYFNKHNQLVSGDDKNTRRLTWTVKKVSLEHLFFLAVLADFFKIYAETHPDGLHAANPNELNFTHKSWGAVVKMEEFADLFVTKFSPKQIQEKVQENIGSLKKHLVKTPNLDKGINAVVTMVEDHMARIATADDATATTRKRKRSATLVGEMTETSQMVEAVSELILEAKIADDVVPVYQKLNALLVSFSFFATMDQECSRQMKRLKTLMGVEKTCQHVVMQPHVAVLVDRLSTFETLVKQHQQQSMQTLAAMHGKDVRPMAAATADAQNMLHTISAAVAAAAPAAAAAAPAAADSE
jgi:hypothetical protein